MASIINTDRTIEGNMPEEACLETQLCNIMKDGLKKHIYQQR